jgi:hypothetical protein
MKWHLFIDKSQRYLQTSIAQINMMYFNVMSLQLSTWPADFSR